MNFEAGNFLIFFLELLYCTSGSLQNTFRKLTYLYYKLHTWCLKKRLGNWVLLPFIQLSSNYFLWEKKKMCFFSFPHFNSSSKIVCFFFFSNPCRIKYDHTEWEKPFCMKPFHIYFLKWLHCYRNFLAVTFQNWRFFSQMSIVYTISFIFNSLQFLRGFIIYCEGMQ